MYVNGAHQKPERYTPRYTLVKSQSSTGSSAGSTEVRTRSARLAADSLSQFERLAKKPSGTAPKQRKQWTRCSLIIKTDDGCEIKINAPRAVKSAGAVPKTKPDDHYSDDFESDSDAEHGFTATEAIIDNVRFDESTSSSSDESIPEEVPSEKPFGADSNKKITLNLKRSDVKVIRSF